MTIYYYSSREPDTYRTEAADLEEALSFAAFDLNHHTARSVKIVMHSGITCNLAGILDMLRTVKTVESTSGLLEKEPHAKKPDRL